MVASVNHPVQLSKTNRRTQGSSFQDRPDFKNRYIYFKAQELFRTLNLSRDRSSWDPLHRQRAKGAISNGCEYLPTVRVVFQWLEPSYSGKKSLSTAKITPLRLDLSLREQKTPSVV